ncbi:MAG: hypothetical protein IH600_02630 [Bacteroidetes bacterium]|nr:hypothetical protein [Bacteroidota bacterium]
MKQILPLLVLILLVACSSKQEDQNTQQTGTASGTMAGEVISADNGYIIENAGIAADNDAVAFSIKGVVKLKEATSQVMIVRTQSTDGNATEMLVLEFPSFAEGTALDYVAGSDKSTFWIFGLNADKQEIMRRTGAVEGNLRLVKLAPAQNSMGLNREVMDGTGEMEIVVSGIDNGGLAVPAEKKYAARYQLPIITLNELARINQPI